MRIRTVTANNRKKAFEVRTASNTWTFPYALADPAPSSGDLVTDAHVDEELGREGFSYRLSSGAEGTIHIDQVRESNQDPAYLRDLLVYELTLKAQRLVEESPLSKREIIRRLGTSPAQLYRLLDQTNYRKSIDRLLELLQVLGCEVEILVKAKSA